MKASGFDNTIINLLADNKIIYAGFSAGVVLLHPDLHGLEKVDDPHGIPDGYNPEIEWSGLGVLNFRVAVHYQSDNPESHLVDEEINYYQNNHIPHKTLRDGQVLIVNDKEVKLVE